MSCPLSRCNFCPGRLEVLARYAGVSAAELRAYLRTEIERRKHDNKGVVEDG